jgi:ribose-phosphate pyrophosphokinase
VTELKSPVNRRLVLVSGRAHPELAGAVARELGTSLVHTTAYDFANGEIYVRFAESVRGGEAFVLQSYPAPTNRWIMEHLLMVDALKRASVKRITAILPFYPYGRQDKKHRGREPISARLIADLFRTAGAHRLMSVDLHAAQSQGFFDGPVDHLWAMPILTDYVRTRVDLKDLAVVSPDAGRIRVAEKWASKMGECPLAFVHKTRDLTRPNSAVANRVVGDVEGKDCVLVDDLIDTGGTIAEAVKVLMNAGAKGVIVAATHGVLSDPAARRLQDCGAREVVVTDTLPIPAEKRFPQLTVLSIAPLIARAIHEVFDDGSVTSLLDGNT